MKKIVGIIAGIIVLVNAIYISNEYYNIKQEVNMMESMMRMGIGTKAEHSIINSIYGKRYEVKVRMENNEIVTNVEWK